MTTTIAVDLQDGMLFESAGQDGTSVSLDSDPEHGGMGGGFRPMELLLIAAGSCTAMDVISILRKKRQEVAGYRVEVSGEQSSRYPRVFTRISLRHIFHGDNLSEDAVRRSIELSEMTYCPAIAMLRQSAEIDSTFEIHPASPPD